jgi:hypothetical protein
LGQQSRFFGGGSPSVVLNTASWLDSVRMTATAHFYTSQGFSVAVDGRQRWCDVPSFSAHLQSLESDQVQKLFEIHNQQMTLCYTVKGDVVNEDRRFDLTKMLRQQVRKLRDDRFRSGHAFAEAFAKATEQGIRGAKDSGTLECFPSSEVTLVGYFKRKPVWFDIQFKRGGFLNGRLARVGERTVNPGLCVVSGSQEVISLVAMDHPLVENFRFPVDEKTSLEIANKITTGYVRACCSDWILQYEPTCKSCGGHVHTATITAPQKQEWSVSRMFSRTPPEPNGFQWVIPPIAQ